MHERTQASRIGGALISLLAAAALLAQTGADVQQKIGALEQQVQKHLQEQKPLLAIPVLREIVSLDPNNLNARANLGVLLYFQGNNAEAIPHMREALQLQPDLWRILALLGIAEKRIGDSESAQEDLQRAFPNLDDKNIRTQAGLELIEIYSSSAQLEKALSVVAQLRVLAPDNPQILFVAHHLARQMMDQSLLDMMTTAPDSAEMHMMMGGELGRQGDSAGAVAQYREAIRLNPDLPGVHFELAEQLRISTDSALNAQAEEAYKAAIKLNRYDEKSWRQLGGLMAARGEFQAAGEHYRTALALQPNDSEAKTGLALVLSSTNRSGEAIAMLESAVEDDPTNITALYRLGTLYRRAGRIPDSQHALDAYEHYKGLREKLDRVYRQLGGSVRENPKAP
jgi:tetratricopeptide (TPR) repeat protein